MKELSTIKTTAKDVTGTAMSIASKTLGNHFNHNGRYWVLDKSAPPSLSDAYAITADVIGLRAGADWIGNETSWLLGNMVWELRNLYGADFDIKQIEDMTSRAPNTICSAEQVFNAFRDARVPGLSYTAHKEVFYTANLTDKQKLIILQSARTNKFTARQVRILAKYVSHNDERMLVDGTTALSILNTIEPKKNKTKHYVVISYDNIPRRVTGRAYNEKLKDANRTVLQIAPEMVLIKNDING